jgi:hypothetical protein
MYIYRPEINTYTPVEGIVEVGNTTSRVGDSVYFPGIIGGKFSRDGDTFYMPAGLHIKDPATQEAVVFLQSI